MHKVGVIFHEKNAMFWRGETQHHFCLQKSNHVTSGSKFSSVLCLIVAQSSVYIVLSASLKIFFPLGLRTQEFVSMTPSTYSHAVMARKKSCAQNSEHFSGFCRKQQFNLQVSKMQKEHSRSNGVQMPSVNEVFLGIMHFLILCTLFCGTDRKEDNSQMCHLCGIFVLQPHYNKHPIKYLESH